jgi:hypothetical protein
MGRYALANLLGGIGYFHGDNLVQSDFNPLVCAISN